MKSKQSTQNCSYLLLVPIALRYSPFQAALYILEVADLPSLRPLPAGYSERSSARCAATVSWRRARVDLSTRSNDRAARCVRRGRAKSKCPGQTAESEVTEHSGPMMYPGRPKRYGFAANWPPITGGCTSIGSDTLLVVCALCFCAWVLINMALINTPRSGSFVKHNQLPFVLPGCTTQ
jgi:hypothetical protein